MNLNVKDAPIFSNNNEKYTHKTMSCYIFK